MVGKTLHEATLETQNNKRALWDEQDIPNQGYNLAHIQENWVDEGTKGTYLGLSQWCLCSKSGTEIPDKQTLTRQPLPEDGKFLKSHVIFGTVVPPKARPTTRPIPIVIKQPLCWVIDRSRHLRGIWVQSSYSDFWYWLKDPSSEAVPSQETLHTPLRAKLGLLSNLIDIIQECSDGKPFNYVPLIAKRTPQSVHRMLTPSPTQWAYFSHLPLKSDSDLVYPFTTDFMGHNYLGNSYPLLNQEPFDLDLLYTCADFIQHHLENMSPYLNKSSDFMTGLSAMQAEYTKYTKANPRNQLTETNDEMNIPFKLFSHDDYVLSATKSEERGFRHPWGELAHNADIQPNRWIEFIVQYRLADANHVPQVIEGSGLEDQVLSSTVQCIMRGLKDKNHEAPTSSKLTIQLMYQPITTMVESIGFSSTQLCMALRGLAAILIPTPSVSELTNKNMTHDQISQYHFCENKTVELGHLILGDYPDSQGIGHVPSVEWMYVIVDCMRRSGTKVLKSIFKGKTKTSLTPFAIIFKHWLSLAIHRVQTTSEADKKKKHPIDVLLIQSVMLLIVDCTVINTMNQITILSKLSVDWFYIVDKTLDFAITNKLMDVVQSAKLAKKRLDGIKANSLLLIQSTENTVTTSVLVPEEESLKDKETRQKRLSRLMMIARNTAVSSVLKPADQFNKDDSELYHLGAASYEAIDLSHDSVVASTNAFARDSALDAKTTNSHLSHQMQSISDDNNSVRDICEVQLETEPISQSDRPNGSVFKESLTSTSSNTNNATSSSSTTSSGGWKGEKTGSQDAQFSVSVGQSEETKVSASTNTSWGGWTRNITESKSMQSCSNSKETKNPWANATKLQGSCAPSWGSVWRPPKEVVPPPSFTSVDTDKKYGFAEKSNTNMESLAQNSTSTGEYQAQAALPTLQNTTTKSVTDGSYSFDYAHSHSSFATKNSNVDILTGHERPDSNNKPTGQNISQSKARESEAQPQDKDQIHSNLTSNEDGEIPNNPLITPIARGLSEHSLESPKKIQKTQEPGNGRGRLRTLPSWMTNPSLDKQEVGKIEPDPVSRTDYNKSLISESLTSTSSSQIGRGRGRVLPSWMTAEKGASSSVPEQYEKVTTIVQTSFPTELPAGRGRGRTLPAWMAKEKMPY